MGKKTKNDEGTLLRPAQVYIKYLEIRSEVCSCCNCITPTMRHNITACLEVFGNMHQLLRKWQRMGRHMYSLVPRHARTWVSSSSSFRPQRAALLTCRVLNLPPQCSQMSGSSIQHLCWCMGPVLWLWPRMQSTAQSSKCSSLRLFKGVKRLERVNCWTSESCARKPCPRNSAPIEDVATPWPHYSLSQWWFCCKIQTLWDLWPDAIQTWNLSVTQSMIRMIRPQNANAFPNELHTPPETTMYLTPCEMAHGAVFAMFAVCMWQKRQKKLKETQGETWKNDRNSRAFSTWGRNAALAGDGGGTTCLDPSSNSSSVTRRYWKLCSWFSRRKQLHN